MHGFSGYCYNFDMCCSKNCSDQRKDLQQGSKVVLKMFDAVGRPHHTQYFLATFSQVVHYRFILKSVGFQAIETIR